MAIGKSIYSFIFRWHSNACLLIGDNRVIRFGALFPPLPEHSFGKISAKRLNQLSHPNHRVCRYKVTLIPADLNSKETGYYYPLLIDVTLVQNNRNKNNTNTDEAKGHAPRVMRSQVAARDTAGPIHGIA